MSKAGSLALTSQESSRLTECEKVIETNVSAFVAVGRALVEIRDGKLYRADHKTFEAYCQERWGMGRRHANRLIEASQVTENLGPTGTQKVPEPKSERQVRELAKVDEPKQQAEAWEKAVEKAGGEQPTAKQVKEAVEEVAAKDKPRVAEKVPTDELGVPLPQNLLLPFQARERFKALLSLIRKVESEVDELARVEGGEHFAKGLRCYGKDGKQKYRDADLENFKRHVQFLQPHCACPYCAARAKCLKTFKDCKACGGLGWVPKSTFDSAPKDYRETLEALAVK